MPDTLNNIWFYSTIELTDMLPIMAALFECDDFDRDYESVWEWVEGYSNKYKAKINISREHNWTHGCYDTPIIVRVEFDIEGKDMLSIIEIIAKDLFKKLSATIYWGQILITKDHTYQLLESGKYTT